jgi:tetratricopeptide (TPR) repeat protein
MTLADERLRGLDNLTLTEDRRTELRCEVSEELAYAGQYEAAREALGGLWPGIGERPDVRGLPPVVAAEVLLQCGVLTGWLGSVRNVAGSQERAKDLLFEALRTFQSQGKASKVSEAQYELGMCYWRLGAYDEARVIMREALRPLGDEDAELKAKILIRITAVEVWENRYYEALRILEEAEPVFESVNDATKGRWHGQRGTVFLWLASTGRQDYADRAIIEFTAAIYHYEQAGHERYCALNLNNLAFVLYRLGRYGDAHENLDRAQAIFTRLKDTGNLAQVDETRARVFVGEGKYRDAERIIAAVVKAFEQGSTSALLADALVVQGIARARLGSYDSSINIFRQAIKVAQDAGAETKAGLAALTLIEEHGERRLPESELLDTYLRADTFLKNTQDAEDVARLRSCARLIARRIKGLGLRERNFSLHGAIHDLEARFIEQALDESKGSVAHAAKLLGMEHQSLIYALNTRHRKLAGKRTPAKKRNKSIMRKPAKE